METTAGITTYGSQVGVPCCLDLVIDSVSRPLPKELYIHLPWLMRWHDQNHGVFRGKES